MPQILAGPFQTQKVPQRIAILVDDKDLTQAMSECPTPQAQSELLQDFAEIGVRVAENYQTDQSIESIVKAMEQERKQDRIQIEQQRQDERARWEHQRQLERQADEHRRAQEKARHDQELAEQRRLTESQLQEQKVFFERRAQIADRIRDKERAEHQNQLTTLNETVRELTLVVQDNSQEGRLSIERFEKKASGLLKSLLTEVREKLIGEDHDGDRLVEMVEETLDGLTGKLQDDFDRAALLIQSLSEREQARQQADELREKTSNYKGVEFEKGVLNDLVEFAGARTGDVVEHTGANPVGDSKKGDLVYTLQTHNGPVRVVLEAKDKELKHNGTSRYFLDELRDARKLRGGDYGIVVASLDENSEKNGRPRDPFFKDLGEGNFLVLVDETRPYSIALRTALHWIHNLEKSSEGSDANAELFQRVQTGLERIEQLSYSFRNLKSSTTSASNALSGLRRQLDELDRNLEEEVKSLGALLE